MKPNKCPDCGRTIPKGKSAWECPCLFQTNPNMPVPLYPVTQPKKPKKK